jgi:hypothetical protein
MPATLGQPRVLRASPPVRAKPPEAQPRGPAIPLAVGRRSHAGGSSAALRSAPRRGASRGRGFEAALRRTARSPVVTRTVSHGSEPIQRGDLRGGLLVAGKAPGALPVVARSGYHGGPLVPLDRLRDSSGLPLPCTRGTHSGLRGAPFGAVTCSSRSPPSSAGGESPGPGYAQLGRSVQGLSDGVPRLPDERLMRTWTPY